MANHLELDGVIRANGGHAAYTHSSGGSGGGIRLDVGTLVIPNPGSGSALIQASGGNDTTASGGGGGGRIAVYYDSLDANVYQIFFSFWY